MKAVPQTVPPLRERYCSCGRLKVLVRYESGMTCDRAGVEYGETYGLLACGHCDGTTHWPRIKEATS